MIQSNSFIHSKKAQRASSAVLFVLLLTVVIVAYVLVLPPADRAALLGDGSQNGNGGSQSSDDLKYTLLDENIGRLDYLKFNDRTHELPSFRLFTTIEAMSLKTESSIYVKNSAISKKEKELNFDVEKENVRSLLLSFNVEKASGKLFIYLNGHEIFAGELKEGSPAPIVLPKEDLEQHNILLFQVDSPGWLFWRVNEYQLTNLMVAADIEDYSKSSASQRFFISEEEGNNIERATLWFYPDCRESGMGILSIELNGDQIYSAVPDCGVNNHFELDPALLENGDNSLFFEITSGSLLLDQVKVKTELKEMVYPIYYFEIDDGYFRTGTQYSEDEEYCGNVDDICPANCDEDDDKDCCFEDNINNYWCDAETDNADDRCVGFVEQSTLARCPSGYEENNNRIAELAEELCGDDTDGECPSGCSVYYDKDCCFVSSPNNYWCDDLPKTGLSSTCEQDVSSGECDDCPLGYYSEDRGRPSCGDNSDDADDEVDVLKKEYDVNLTIKFPDDRVDHKADLIINGRTIHLDTRKSTYSRFIDDYVEKGANSLEIIPRTNLDIVKLTVKIKKH
ncbi:MAG: hypothetical protein V1659_05235 [Candidatus Woesearchaeota archaeon]